MATVTQQTKSVTYYYRGKLHHGAGTNPNHVYPTRKAAEPTEIERPHLEDDENNIRQLKVTFPGDRFFVVQVYVSDGLWKPQHRLDVPVFSPERNFAAVDYEFAFEVVGEPKCLSRQAALANCACENSLPLKGQKNFSRPWSVVIELGETKLLNGFFSGYSTGGAGMLSSWQNIPFRLVVATSAEVAKHCPESIQQVA